MMDPLAQRRAELERRLAALSPAKRALLDQGGLSSAPAARAAGIRTRTTGAWAPMSFAQELLWLLDQATPGMHGYNVPRVTRLRGALDVPALEAALSTVVERHEVLRSTFVSVDGVARQVVHPATPVRIARIDLQSVPGHERERAAAEAVRDVARRPFDLARDPLLRATVIDLAPDDRILLLESHHVASDAWSRGILFREIAECYDARIAGRQAALQPLAIQYGDFAAWQRETLSGDRLSTLLDFWRGDLAGAPERLDLPADRTAAATQSGEGRVRTRVIPASLLDALRDFSQARGATLFMTLLAAFDVLLARYSGQDDIVVGSPIAGRSQPETEPLIGFFANTLVLRARLEDDPSFATLLQRVRATALAAYEHQDVPYEKLVLELMPGRLDPRASLFQVMFTLQDAERRPLALAGTEIVPFSVHRGVTKFDLSLSAQETADGLRTSIEYRADLFEDATIDRMLGHFEQLLAQAVAHPASAVSTLDLLDEGERATLTRAWAAGSALGVEATADSVTLDELVWTQARRTPDAVAVVDAAPPESDARVAIADRASLTYAELVVRAERVASVLATQGVGRGSIVGICLSRGADMIAAVLGVLRAGAGYVPLDPAYPADRVRFMLRDAGARVVITDATTIEKLSWLGEAFGATADSGAISPVTRAPSPIDGTTLSCVVSGSDAHVPAPLATHGARDVAYLIYTSGSTGVPKGVVLEHRNAVAFVAWARQVFSEDELRGVLAATSLSFDLSIFEIFVPLSTGGTVIVVPNALALAAPSWTAPMPVTLINTVPSAAAALVRAGAIPATVTTVNLAGEPLTPALVDALYAQPTVQRVYDLYGPSETTTYSTFALRARGGAATIGRPIAGTRAYVLDAHRRPVPVGVRGELYIGGAGVTRGYLGRPELTAERFVADPFVDHDGARMYRTGDVVRWRGDATLEYLGRADRQVKLRGFRIELGEIEAALEAQAFIRDAAVVVRTDGDVERLIAYCVAAAGVDGGATSDVTARAREALQARLPAFMVPAAFEWLSALPLTPNGKVDRRGLPAPTLEASTASVVAPRTETESAIATLWSEMLQLPDVGATDDFFALGGHSLAALRVAMRLQERFGIRISLQTVLEHSSVAALAAVVDAAVAARSGDSGGIKRIRRETYRREDPSLPQVPNGSTLAPRALSDVTE